MNLHILVSFSLIVKDTILYASHARGGTLIEARHIIASAPRYFFCLIEPVSKASRACDTVVGSHMWPRWILVITATNRNGQNLNGHKPKRPQTGTATNRNGHKPKRPQTGTATNRNGHKPKRPQTETATNRNGHKLERPQTGTATNKNRHNYIWFSGLQICVLNIRFKLVSRSRQK